MDWRNKLLDVIAPRTKAAEYGMVAEWQYGNPLPSQWDGDKAVREGLKTNAWVYSALRYHARVLPPVPLFAETLQGEEWQRDDSHPLSILLGAPVANNYFDGAQLRERWIYSLYLTGNALVHMPMARGVPIEMWPLFSQNVQPVPGRDGWIDHYRYTVPGGKQQRIPVEEVIHLQFTDPQNLYWGLAPLQAAARVVDTDNMAVNWNRTSLQNRARKDLVFYPAEPLSREQYKQAREAASQMSGPENAGGVLVASTPGKFENMNFSPVEMDYINTRHLSRSEILAVLDMKEILLTGQGTFRNFEHAQRQQWVDVYVPMLDDIVRSLNSALVPFWDFEARRRDGQPKLRINYDISGIAAMQENFGEKLEHAERLARLGFPLDEINERLGLGFEDVPADIIDINNVTAASGKLPASSKRARKQREPGGAMWKQRDDAIAPMVDRTKKEFATVLRKEGDIVAEAYRRGGQSSAMRIIDTNKATWRETLKATYEGVIGAFAPSVTRSRSEPTRMRTKRLSFTEWEGDIPNERSGLIVDATKERIRGIVQSGIAVGASPDDIATTILATYGDMSDARAETIARTEVHAASEWARMESESIDAAERGQRLTKEWLSMWDDAVRDSHAYIHGEVKSTDEEFSNGLSFPGDPTGPASEVANCRCYLVYDTA